MARGARADNGAEGARPRRAPTHTPSARPQAPQPCSEKNTFHLIRCTYRQTQTLSVYAPSHELPAPVAHTEPTQLTSKFTRTLTTAILKFRLQATLDFRYFFVRLRLLEAEATCPWAATIRTHRRVLSTCVRTSNRRGHRQTHHGHVRAIGAPLPEDEAKDAERKKPPTGPPQHEAAAALEHAAAPLLRDAGEREHQPCTTDAGKVGLCDLHEQHRGAAHEGAA